MWCYYSWIKWYHMSIFGEGGYHPFVLYHIVAHETMEADFQLPFTNFPGLSTVRQSGTWCEYVSFALQMCI